jgi:hypothetical protein
MIISTSINNSHKDFNSLKSLREHIFKEKRIENMTITLLKDGRRCKLSILGAAYFILTGEIIDYQMKRSA